jgi:tRNA modification GTPase
MQRPGDTIAAVATPGGRGGIGIVRVSGPDSARIAKELCGGLPPPRTARYGAFRSADGTLLDRGLILHFPAPASYTGEDVVELHGHGGRAVMDLLLGRVLELGARHAAPGEFTERAFLNGKLDLVQAEAVADLIDSASAESARSAARSLEGRFSARIHELRDRLVDARAFIEAALDFPDEAAEFPAASAAEQRLAEWLEASAILLGQARSGRALRQGLRIVILGPPNAGKSSLLNRLLGSDRAIVDAAPGTTRDTVEESLVVGGIAMHAVDTAGLRDTADAVEAEGVRRALAAAAGADLLLVVMEDERAERELPRLRPQLPAGCRRIIVRNKIDLGGTRACRVEAAGEATISLSAKTGDGLDLLLTELRAESGAAAGEDAILARDRHIVALEQANAAVGRGLEALRSGRGAEVIAEELRGAQQELGRITGEFGADELLGEIFSRFCIGK